MKERILTLLAVAAVAIGFALGGGVTHESAAQNANNNYYREAVLANATVVTVDATGTAVRGWADATLAAFQLACTEDSGTATLDVAIQRSIDGGATWASLVSFTQLSATGGETKLYADVRAASAQMIGDRLRVNFDITGSGQYTCTVAAAAEA